MTPDQKRRVDESIERNLMTLARDARRIGLEEAIGVLKLTDSKEQALALLFRRVRELRAVETVVSPSEPVYLGDVDDDQDT